MSIQYSRVSYEISFLLEWNKHKAKRKQQIRRPAVTDGKRNKADLQKKEKDSMQKTAKSYPDFRVQVKIA